MVDGRSSIVDHRSSMSRSNPLVALPHMALPRALATCALLAAAACGGSSLVLQSPDGSTSPGDDGSVDGMVTDAGVDAPDPCGPTNCQGCCRSDGTCNTVTSVAACGAEGSACTACGAADSCNKPAQGCISNYNAPCTPQNCPTGCCFPVLRAGHVLHWVRARRPGVQHLWRRRMHPRGRRRRLMREPAALLAHDLQWMLLPGCVRRGTPGHCLRLRGCDLPGLHHPRRRVQRQRLLQMITPREPPTPTRGVFPKWDPARPRRVARRHAHRSRRG